MLSMHLQLNSPNFSPLISVLRSSFRSKPPRNWRRRQQHQDIKCIASGRLSGEWKLGGSGAGFRYHQTANNMPDATADAVAHKVLLLFVRQTQHTAVG